MVVRFVGVPSFFDLRFQIRLLFSCASMVVRFEYSELAARLDLALFRKNVVHSSPRPRIIGKWRELCKWERIYRAAVTLYPFTKIQLLIFIEKFLPLLGFEPVTFPVPSQYATNWAILAWIPLKLLLFTGLVHWQPVGVVHGVHGPLLVRVCGCQCYRDQHLSPLLLGKHRSLHLCLAHGKGKHRVEVNRQTDRQTEPDRLMINRGDSKSEHQIQINIIQVRVQN